MRREKLQDKEGSEFARKEDLPTEAERPISLTRQSLLANCAEYRRNTGPLDIAIVGNAPSKEQIESRRFEYERQGLITWWLKYLLDQGNG